MKSKKLILGLVMAITMGLSMTAYAANTEATTSTTTHNRVGLARATGVRGYDYVQEILKDKLGLTDTEITNGLNSGKTMYDLAKEKGMTEDEFKAALLEERNQAIDKAVADGTITKEEATSMKETLKNNMDTCTGIPGQGMRQSEASHNNSSWNNAGGKGTGKGHMSASGSRGLANCYFNDTLN